MNPMAPIRIAGISGSLRQASFSTALIKLLARHLQPRLSVGKMPHLNATQRAAYLNCTQIAIILHNFHATHCTRAQILEHRLPVVRCAITQAQNDIFLRILGALLAQCARWAMKESASTGSRFTRMEIFTRSASALERSMFLPVSPIVRSPAR